MWILITIISDSVFYIVEKVNFLFLDKFELDFWFPPDARAIQPNEHFQGNRLD